MAGVTRWLARLRRSSGGGVLIETAVSLPILISLLMGGVEFARFVMLNQKLDRVAGTTGDMVARSDTVSQAIMNDYFLSAGLIAAPFDMQTRGAVIVSTIVADENGAQILWQETGGGGLAATSHIGLAGEAPDLPEFFDVEEGESLVVAEVFYDYEPVFMADVLPTTQVYHRAFYRPRTTSVVAMQGGG